MRVPVLMSCVLAAGVAACVPPRPAVERRTIRLLTGSEGGAYHRLGTELAKAVGERMPQIALQVQLSDGSVSNVEKIEQGDAEVAIAQSDAIYSAFERGTEQTARPHGHLRAMARLFPNAVHVAVRSESPVRSIRDLVGLRVGISDPGSGTASRTMRQVLEAHGIPPDVLSPRAAPRADLLAALRDGTLDAVIAVSGAPAPVITDISHAVGMRLIDVDDRAIHDIRSRFLFFQPITIAAGTYPGQDAPVETVGIDSALICRDSFDDQLAFEFTRAFFESLPALASRVPGIRPIDARHAPTTPIPLHPGAAVYYRERELFR